MITETHKRNLGGTYTIEKNYDERTDTVVAEITYSDGPERIKIVSTDEVSVVSYLDGNGSVVRWVKCESFVSAMNYAKASAESN